MGRGDALARDCSAARLAAHPCFAMTPESCREGGPGCGDAEVVAHVLADGKIVIKPGLLDCAVRRIAVKRADGTFELWRSAVEPLSAVTPVGEGPLSPVTPLSPCVASGGRPTGVADDQVMSEVSRGAEAVGLAADDDVISGVAAGSASQPVASGDYSMGAAVVDQDAAEGGDPTDGVPVFLLRNLSEEAFWAQMPSSLGEPWYDIYKLLQAHQPEYLDVWRAVVKFTGWDGSRLFLALRAKFDGVGTSSAAAS